MCNDIFWIFGILYELITWKRVLKFQVLNVKKKIFYKFLTKK